MNNRPILKDPNDRLRKKAEAIGKKELASAQIQTLIDDLTQTLYVENGVGLASPQIGVSKRLIVVDVGDGTQALINPKIISASLRKIDFEEGCLSVPGVYGFVRRHREVKVRALSRDGKEIIIKARGLLAVVLQHEIDHLDGILFIDKVIRFTSPPRL